MRKIILKKTESRSEEGESDMNEWKKEKEKEKDKNGMKREKEKKVAREEEWD